jgi:uncharacterized phage-associated protein
MNFAAVSLDEDIQFDRSKLLSVVHYICATVPVEELGRVKLHKILYFADMLHYAARGQPLTGVEYQKQPFGPAARHLKWALQTLEDRGQLTVSRRDYFGFPKDDFLSLREPDPESLTGYERELLGEVADFVRLRSARQISEFSHNDAWSAVSMGERIPYYTAYSLCPVALDENDLAWGELEARKVVAHRRPHGG